MLARLFFWFETRVDPYVPTQDATPPRTVWPFLKAWLQPFKRVLLVSAVLVLLVAVIELWLVAYLGRLVDMLETTAPVQVFAAHGGEFLLAALFILFARPLIFSIQVALLNNTISSNVGTLVRWRAHRHVLRQSVDWFENDFAGRITNRIMQTPYAVKEVLFLVIDAIGFAAAYFIGSLVLFASIDWRLLIPVLLWFLPYTLLMFFLVPKVGEASQAASNARSTTTGRIVDSYTNISSVKMGGHQSRELDYAKDAIEHVRETIAMENRLLTLMDVGLVVLGGVMIVGTVGLSVWLWSTGQASLGLVAAASALALRLNAMSGWIMWAATNLFHNLGVLREGLETIAQPIALTDRPAAAQLRVDAGAIKVDGVSHHYGRGTGGLDQVSLTVAGGQKVGLVGPSGAGKSTLIKLMLRFYDVETGEIRIDGQPVQNVTQESLRQKIALVQQEASLLHRSVRDNISYDRPDATEAQIVAAARRASAHDFILDLQDPKGRRGYEAHVGERGIKLSGGQRQRVTLAKAILKDAPILFLDEATSALDSEVEAEIQRALYEMMEGKTVVAVAHRLSTIAQMDRIIVMDQGRIVEDGTHKTLLAQGGLYHRLWSRQTGSFLGET